MPAPRSRILTRATYARTPNSFLVNDPDGFPTDYPPAFWWYGLDSGGGTYPIGPNGPWTTGHGAAQAVVTRATSLIVGPLTGAPFRVTHNPADGPPLHTEAPRWVTDPMLARPDSRFGGNPSQPSAVTRRVRSQFWAEWIRSAIWWGLGAFIYQADQSGQPAPGTMYLIHPGMLATVWDGNHLVWSVGSTAPDSGGTVEFDKDGFTIIGGAVYRIVVLRNPLSPVDESGMSMGVFAMSPSAFALSSSIGTYQAGQFRAGVPNGYLKTAVPGMTQQAADDLKTRWMANHGGDRRSIAILNSTTEFVPINLSPVDAAIGEVKRLNVADVAFAFGLDPMTLGAGLNNSATYSNLRDAWSNHRDFGLAPWSTAVQDTLTALTPAGQTVAPNLDGFANPAPAERFTSYQVAITAGILTVNEVRALEGLPPADTPPPTPEPEQEPTP